MHQGTTSLRRRLLKEHFVAFLRTGYVPAEDDAIPVENKQNPWHDPDTGRFTNVGAGVYVGTPVREATPGELLYRHTFVGGYDYELDESGNTLRVTGNLLTGSQPRSRASQRNAGGADRLPDDDGGHYIAARFNGPPDAVNHFAQNASFNRGAYRAIEDGWAKAKNAGHAVFVDITSYYDSGTRRPDRLQVVWRIDAKIFARNFQNKPQVTKNGK